MDFSEIKLMVFAAGLMTVVAGCGPNSVGDAVSHQMDREREAAMILKKQYAVITGDYSGETGKLIPNTRQIKPVQMDAYIGQTDVSKDGYLLAQPVLNGVISSYPTAGVTVSYNFTRGSYDPLTRKFVAVVPAQMGGATNININCLVNTTQTEMNCKWEPEAPQADRFEFVLRRVDRKN